MKIQILIFVLNLFSFSIVFSQALVYCFPDTGNYNTGATNGTIFTDNSLIHIKSEDAEVAWARFNISAIPVEAIIQSVELNLFIIENNFAKWMNKSLENDPLLGTPSSVYIDCLNGIEYVWWEGDFHEPGWATIQFWPEGVAGLQNSLADGWFGFSFVEYRYLPNFKMGANGWNEERPPWLKVEFSLPPEAPQQAYYPFPERVDTYVEINDDLTWTFGENTDWYDLYFGYDLPYLEKVVDNAPAGTTGFYDPGAMKYGKTYYWKVVSRNDLSTIQTPGRLWSFNTACNIQEMSVFEDFEAVYYPEIPFCWSVNRSGSGGGIHIYDNAYNGMNCLRMWTNGINGEVYFISPKLPGGVAMKYLDLYAMGWCDLSVGTMSDPNDTNSFSEFTFLDVPGYDEDYQEFEVYFADYTGNDEFLALKAIAYNNYESLIIDNILIDDMPTCLKPGDLYKGSLMQTTAEIGWMENGTATTWNVEYGYEGFDPLGIANHVAYSNPTTLIGLEVATAYDFYVQADCGAGDQSYWVGPKGFQTHCMIQDVPYFEGFEGVTPPEIPLCISIENTNDDNYHWETSGNLPHSGSTHFSISYSSHDTTNDWFFSAPLNLYTGENYVVDFYYMSTYSGYIEKLEVYIGTDAMSSAMPDVPIFQDSMITQPTYEHAVCYVEPPADGTYFFGWYVKAKPNIFNLYIDDITVDIAPTCLMPENLQVLSANDSSAFLQWIDPGDANQWNLEYGEHEFVPTGIPNAIANDSPFHLSGLLPDTEYDVYIQGVCGGGDVSWWNGPLFFGTLCVPTEESIIENFDSSPIYELPDCWRVIIESADALANINIVYYNTHSWPQCLEIRNASDLNAIQLLISPPVSNVCHGIRFYAYGNAEKLSVGTITDPFDASTYMVDTCLNLSPEYQEYVIDLSCNLNPNGFIAFKPEYDYGYESVYIDDIEIIPFIPVDITVLLEGPYEEGDMNTDLSDAGILPLSQPYNKFPWFYYGGQSVPSLQGINITDWILVEIRDAATVELAGAGTIVSRQVGVSAKQR
ncbi:MAG: choice-of-anchor J domain-containing protein [Bacteroidales bacterium]